MFVRWHYVCSIVCKEGVSFSILLFVLYCASCAVYHVMASITHASAWDINCQQISGHSYDDRRSVVVRSCDPFSSIRLSQACDDGHSLVVRYCDPFSPLRLS